MIVTLLAATTLTQDIKLPPLKPGVPAPKLSVTKFIKGNPQPSYKPGKVYVIEFWATWCKPCITAMPHMSKLQSLYKDQVTFIGINTLEDSENRESRVTAFVNDMGDKLNYTIALDTDENKTKTAFLDASEQSGIPVAYIVNQSGIISWIGHPMNLDTPLQQTVDKTIDLQNSLQEFRASVQRTRNLEATLKRSQELSKQYKLKPDPRIIKELESLSSNPDIGQSMIMEILSLLINEDPTLSKTKSWLKTAANRTDYNTELGLSIFCVINAADKGAKGEATKIILKNLANELKHPGVATTAAQAATIANQPDLAQKILKNALALLKGKTDDKSKELRSQIQAMIKS